MKSKLLSPLPNYRGNKNIPGIYQWIINRIPPHLKYYELFAGSAAIYFRINNPAVTVLNDCNAGVTASLNCTLRKNTTIVTSDALQLLSTLLPGTTDTFVYCDPPYLFSTRGSSRRIYENEFSDKDHKSFLTAVRTAKFNCMISHYECPLYDRYLKGWTKETQLVSYHGKVKTECIYYNYSKPTVLQCYKYVGSDCWDRQRVTRKIDRLTNKLLNLPALERNAILSRVAADTVTNDFNRST